MFEFPKLVVLILVFGALDRLRWLNGPARELPRRRPAPPRRALQAEDLVACGVCGSYVAAQRAGLRPARLPAAALTPPMRPKPDRELSVADLRTAAFLGAAGLRDPAALRCRGRRRHLSPGDGAARARAASRGAPLMSSPRADRPTAATARTPTGCSNITSCR